MRFEVMRDRGYVVPKELFFIRNHTCTPEISADTWTLSIDGSGVANPIELTYNDILGMEAVTVTRFIECAGNGRGFFGIQQGTPAIGGQWFLGAIGVAHWTGVRLRDVLDLAGLKSTAVDVMPDGLDPVLGANGHVRRPIPIEKALEEDTILAYAMNGEALLADSGFPLRLIVPGWVGVANIKWVGHIEVSETPLFPPFNTTLYVLIGDAYPDRAVLTTQSVKSAFELPFPAELPAGKHILTGRSWSGLGKVRRVQVSFDQGLRWHHAHLRGPNIPLAWVRWEIPWQAEPGDHILMARATDRAGEIQPDSVPFNELGYAFWAVVQHPVTVTTR